MLNAFQKLRKSLTATKDSLFGKISRILPGRAIDEELLDSLEEILIEADVGVAATMRLIERVRVAAREQKVKNSDDVMQLLQEEVVQILSVNHSDSKVDSTLKTTPEVWLITGVNGVGKTTTIGKLATLFTSQGKKVMIGACDTFRAAAVDQIAIWAERSSVEIIRAQEGADPASVAFDSVSAAKARSADILLLDTAGRLHTKSNLMEELKKIKRVIDKAAPDAKVHTLIILDGTTGQNAISQVKEFSGAVGCDGIIITKLDGTARGGVILAIAEELGIPIDYIGVGEGINDLQPFEPSQFTEALFK